MREDKNLVVSLPLENIVDAIQVDLCTMANFSSIGLSMQHISMFLGHIRFTIEVGSKTA